MNNCVWCWVKTCNSNDCHQCFNYLSVNSEQGRHIKKIHEDHCSSFGKVLMGEYKDNKNKGDR